MRKGLDYITYIGESDSCSVLASLRQLEEFLAKDSIFTTKNSLKRVEVT
jgi:hypothetical protein